MEIVQRINKPFNKNFNGYLVRKSGRFATNDVFVVWMFSTVVDIEKERGLLTLQKAESASWNSTYTCYHAEYTLGTEMFALGGLFMK